MNECLHMVKNNEKYSKIIKSSLLTCAWEAHIEKWRNNNFFTGGSICGTLLTILKTVKNKENPQELPAFSCQPAFGSHSQSLINKLFSSFFYMSLMWAFHAFEIKRYFFQVCMHSLIDVPLFKLFIVQAQFFFKPNKFFFFLLPAFLRNFFLCQDHWCGDVPPRLGQPYYVALGQALIYPQNQGSTHALHALYKALQPGPIKGSVRYFSSIFNWLEFEDSFF